jgi:alkanesulfonate monooxygenase
LCDAEERDYAAIEKTVPFAFDVGPESSKTGEVIRQLRALADQGAQTVLGWVVGQEKITPIHIMGRDVIPAVADF